jgi:hypothetical protein
MATLGLQIKVGAMPANRGADLLVADHGPGPGWGVTRTIHVVMRTYGRYRELSEVLVWLIRRD